MAKLHFYYSTMNAGKTTTLLQSSYNYQERGMKTLLFKPLVDNRVRGNKIASRIGLKEKAFLFDDSFNFFEYVGKHATNVSCILVDEAQFLKKDQVRQLCYIVDVYNIPVLAYGLRSDFRGEPFEGSQYLLAWAEELSEIKAICHCGRKAIMNIRVDTQGQKVQEGAQIEIGGNERYIAVCRKHYSATDNQSVQQVA